MVQSWGVVFKADVPAPGLSKEPISIILTDDAGRTLTATDVIPATWKPDGIYTSSVTSFV
ncbi:unnamed protein product [Cuscuta europaea]|uniref:Expansin-like CBD domain-containing protein n=1 Tax=Cuscuta europaea TaxID=41803 RepID=A0A9P0ZQ11_CUSEU|nr:unnamed protein product [Cuscuta europaea]CAH9110083.1 unnamed protein product [Cuscuta europaea]